MILSFNHITQHIIMIEAENFSAQENDSKEEKKVHSVEFEAFLKDFESKADPDSKLQCAIEFMESTLSQGETPLFRCFWEARRLCLPFFKESNLPNSRNQLWAKYTDLSKEARRLKDLLDEQSSFAAEQIDKAIQAMEKEIEQFAEHTSQKSLFENIQFPISLKSNRALYEEIQRKLDLLNAQASRINALRKELIKTNMRISQKNKLFQRLSVAGDYVFPRRKDFIKQVSQQFVEDVQAFIKENFTETIDSEILYGLREEIKSLQHVAKILTLNTGSFTQTRTLLSECWERLKVEDKERKKERAQLKVVFKENAQVVYQQLNEFKETFEKGELSLAEANKKLDEIAVVMRKVELGRDELQALRKEFNDARQAIQSKINAEVNARQQEEDARQRQRKEKIEHMKAQAEALVHQNDQYDADQLIEQRDLLLAEISKSEFSKHEKLDIERCLKPLRDIITEKREKVLLDLSEDDRNALNQLKEVLQQRKERRQTIKNQLEQLRKSSGSSGLDFEMAMQFQVSVNEEKERLEKANEGIKEIEQKIARIEQK